MRLVFDLEANGFYWEASRLHCLVAKDIESGDLYKFGPSEVEQGLKLLMQADQVIGHNVIGYDLPLAQKLHPWFSIERDRVVDTLVLSRLIHTDLSDKDHQVKVEMEAKLYGSHSLKAWGFRLGILKSDYTGGFDEFSDEMLEYNVQDVVVTERLYEKLIKHEALSERANVLEHQVAHIVAQQEKHGFLFNKKAAEELTALLQIRRGELEAKLQDTFPPWDEYQETFTPKANNKKMGYVKGVPVDKYKTVVFNPGSRHHIANRLKAFHGWQPKEFTPDGRAKVDESILGKLPYPEAKLLTEYLMVQKRLGMLAEGNNAWLSMLKPDGRIHGEVITNGAVTGRATHRNPNVAQTPSVTKDEDKNILFGSAGGYGYECRQLFTVPKGKRLVGVDVSGLELRMLAFYMSSYDGGKYGKEVVEGDVHTLNMEAAGLPTRDVAKRWIYAFLYGAGDAKLGLVAGKSAKRGKLLKQQFLSKTPALARLISDVQRAAGRGYLIGLDGRRIHIRSSHAALNSLLQCGGSLVCKQFLVEVDKMVEANGWRNKAQQVAWIHDEIQCEVDDDIADAFGRGCVECISKAGEFFNINIPLTGEYKIGANWAETH